MSLKIMMGKGCKNGCIVLYKGVKVPAPIWARGLCKKCDQKLNSAKHIINKSYKRSIPKKSKKRAKEDTQYAIARRIFLIAHPICQARLPNICQWHATDVHHRKMSHSFYLDISTWMSVCRNCHTAIEEMPFEEALQKHWRYRDDDTPKALTDPDDF